MNEEERENLRAALEPMPWPEAKEAAWGTIRALCLGEYREGGRQWSLSIPVRPDDPDVVLANALRAGETEVARLRSENERLAQALTIEGGNVLKAKQERDLLQRRVKELEGRR